MDECTDAKSGEQRRQHSMLAVKVGLVANILLARIDNLRRVYVHYHPAGLPSDL
jgi:hypothetical protein